MCWSLQVSVASATWCMLMAGFATAKRHTTPRAIWYARFLLTLAMVQVTDAVFWAYEEELLTHVADNRPQTQCGPVNQFMSSYILPMVLTYGALEQVHCACNHRGWRLPKWIVGLKYLWILSAPFRFEMYWDSPLPRCTSVIVGDATSLVWADVSTSSGKPWRWVVLGTASFSMAFLAMKPFRFGFGLALLAITSSMLVYLFNPSAWGSNWCAVAVLFSLVFVMDLITYNKPTADEVASNNKRVTIANDMIQRQRSGHKQRRKAINAVLNGKLAVMKEFENYPFLTEFRARTGLKEFHVACVLMGIFFFSLMWESQIRTFSNIVGFAFPAWASIDALESSNKHDDTQWLTYWLLFGSFSVMEITLLGYLQSILPFYFAFKIGFLVWAQAPNARGAQFMYSRVITPLLKDHSMIPARLNGQEM